MNERNIQVLLVEDQPAAVRLVQEVFKDNEVSSHLYVAKDGVEAMTFLRREDQYTDVPRPHLILLDLSLPKKNGREVLGEIKSDEELKRIPVVILTVSESEEDISQTYDQHANCYITKPIHLGKFIEVIKSIENFWFNIAQLPPG